MQSPSFICHFIVNVITYQKWILAANSISTILRTKQNMLLFVKSIRGGAIKAVLKQNQSREKISKTENRTEEVT